MTASVDNGFAHVLFKPDAEQVHVRAVRLPSGVQHRQPAGQHVVGAHLQRRRSPTRSATSSTARARRELQLRIGGFRRHDTRTTTTSSASRDRTRCSSRSTAASPATTTSTGRRTKRLAGHESGREDRPAAAPRAGDLHQPDTNGGHPYPTIAFEADLPAIESTCDRRRRRLRQPAAGREVLPVLLHRKSRASCAWQEGGQFIPDTINTFGGTAEFGTLLAQVFPVPGFTTATAFENFNSGDLANPCMGK